MKIRNKLIILFLIICSISNAQTYTYTEQVWSRLELIHSVSRIQLNEQIENRYDYKTDKSFNQFRVQFSKCIDTISSFGAGITIRPGEVRLHESFSINVSKFTIEQRIFKDIVRYRFRYMIYPRLNINSKNWINLGIEYMVNFENINIVPDQIRFMIDYTRVLDNNHFVKIGYMSSIFPDHIIHSLRITGQINY